LAEYALGKVAGEGAAGAAAAALAALGADPRGEGQGGLILVTSEGEVATAFNTESMPTARRP
ncbi:isoaspartyl peptidase/L-asparaginase, partial [bacterium]|nr:isoaspartyl peptidase/L-asparaginase [bacterium]